MTDRLLLADTSYAQALANPRDQFHARAIALVPRFEKAQVWVTESVLTEIADGLASIDRGAAVSFAYAASSHLGMRGSTRVDTEMFRERAGPLFRPSGQAVELDRLHLVRPDDSAWPDRRPHR